MSIKIHPLSSLHQTPDWSKVEKLVDQHDRRQRRESPIMRVKYPRTSHLPWSPGRSSDDIALPDCEHLDGRAVVITEKLDGENTTIYSDGTTHARSLDSAHHVSRSWVKQFAAQIAPNVPSRWRICGENMYARHSIAYDRLPSYFMAFAIYDDSNVCLSWDDTVKWCALIGIAHVPELGGGVWSPKMELQVRDRNFQPQYGAIAEGYVVRVSEAFYHADFHRSVAKCVRKGHVQTDEHWMQQAVVANGLA